VWKFLIINFYHLEKDQKKHPRSAMFFCSLPPSKARTIPRMSVSALLPHHQKTYSGGLSLCCFTTRRSCTRNQKGPNASTCLSAPLSIPRCFEVLECPDPQSNALHSDAVKAMIFEDDVTVSASAVVEVCLQYSNAVYSRITAASYQNNRKEDACLSLFLRKT